MNLEKKGGFYVQCFTVKGDSFGLKCQYFTEKGGSFWTEKSVFYCKKGVVLLQKRGHFQTGEQGWVPFVPVSEGAGGRLDYKGILINRVIHTDRQI